MATVNSGTYIIRPVVNTSLALDIAGDVDHRGANVYLDSYAKDDGQFWHLIGVTGGCKVVNGVMQDKTKFQMFIKPPFPIPFPTSPPHPSLPFFISRKNQV